MEVSICRSTLSRQYLGLSRRTVYFSVMIRKDPGTMMDLRALTLSIKYVDHRGNLSYVLLLYF